MRELARGDATTIGLASLIQLAEGAAITGRLVLANGVITMRLGAPVDARCRTLTGRLAFYELFLGDPGTFVLEEDEVSPAPPLGDLGSLVLEGCRLSDEWAAVANGAATIAAGATVPEALAPLREGLDGRRPLAALVDAAGCARVTLVDALVASVEAGVLRLCEPSATAAPPSPAVAPLGGFDVAVEAARRLVREGRLGEAREQLVVALALRPEDRVATQNLRRLTALMGAS